MMEKTENTDRVITSWMVLSCAVENSYEPMRFAGTWKQYSKKAMPQLARMTFQSASLRYLRWPYQAKVIKIFETVSRTIVSTGDVSGMEWDSVQTQSSVNPLRKQRIYFGSGARDAVRQARPKSVNEGFNTPPSRSTACEAPVRYRG